MMRPLAELDWRDITEAVPAIMTGITIPLTFSIADGIGLGFLTYVLVKVMVGRGRECSPMLVPVALLFALKSAWR